MVSVNNYTNLLVFKKKHHWGPHIALVQILLFSLSLHGHKIKKNGNNLASLNYLLAMQRLARHIKHHLWPEKWIGEL